ncbi:hypothetical protein F8388_016582 [Cannabis sativa]|uniref:Transcription factor MYC/MYB N-terminal domain-containing protein n=1 Tax=Cannabis sativa TaxID=3483 RepID=A0A7J6EYD7_CANSA|nr:hypothetical protein F8388_016582 [Cannabis sativa]KAF4395781.1 hypothetical protein G4B88_013555 [Cannabis sativa]
MERMQRFKNRGDRRRRLVRKTISMAAIFEINTVEFSNSEEEKIDEDAVKNDDGTILSQRSNETLSEWLGIGDSNKTKIRSSAARKLGNVRIDDDDIEEEDGYCDITKPAERKSDDSYFNGTKALSFSGFEITMSDIGSRGCPIELAVANLSCLYYTVKQLVGEVAYTGSHAWVFLNNLSTGYVYSKLLPETVLLVPVPDGVLQLGSLETVAEDMAAVGLIRDRYDAFHTMMDERSSRGVEQRWAIVVSLISTDRIPGRAIIISVIDNLLKGALGQAMHAES